MAEHSGCGGCWWWQPRCTSRGECRRHAPRVAAHINSEPETVWPMTRRDDYCGDWFGEMPS